MSTPHNRHRLRLSRRAFTLIEIMVSISVIAVLVSLALPGLARAREGAKQTQALANIRTVGSAFMMYADQYQYMPFVGKGRPPVGQAQTEGTPPMDEDVLGVYWWPRGTIIATSDHWELAWLWPAPLSVMFPWEDHYATWVSVGRRRTLPETGQYIGDIQRTISLRYSNAFLASGQLWAKEPSAAPTENLVRGTRITDVRSPARKVLLWDGDLSYLVREPERVGEHYKAPTPMAFADGHAAVHDPTVAKGPVKNPLSGYDAMTLHDTENGVAGEDY
ncbi:MAG: type II secretion system protein [Phycisphaerales bacterium]